MELVGDEIVQSTFGDVSHPPVLLSEQGGKGHFSTELIATEGMEIKCRQDVEVAYLSRLLAEAMEEKKS